MSVDKERFLGVPKSLFWSVLGVLIVVAITGGINLDKQQAVANTNIEVLQGDVVEIKEDVSVIQTDLTEIDKTQTQIKTTQDIMLKQMDSTDKKIDDILKKLD